MTLQLVVIAGPDKDRHFTLQEGADQMLGRGHHSQYHLSDLRVDRCHCQILLEGNQATVIDDDSEAGIFVNGVRVRRQVLQLGDVLQVGDSQLRLIDPEALPARGRSGGPLSSTKLPGGGPLSSTKLPAGAPVSSLNLAAGTNPYAEAVAALAALSGQMLSHYEVGRPLGQGRSSMVFKARDSKTGKLVALKVLAPNVCDRDEDVEHFVRVVKAVLPLRHPHLVALLGAGKTGRYCWVALELVEGENLTRSIERVHAEGLVDWEDAYRVGLHASRSLDFAHTHQVLHGHISPRNIFLDTGDRVKLGDLRLAQALEAMRARHLGHADPGPELPYLPPERTRKGAHVDGRADLYSLGAVLYALLTGRPPFLGESLSETVRLIREATPPSPSRFQKAVPHRLEQLVLKLLAKDPDARYATAGELVTALEGVGTVLGVAV